MNEFDLAAIDARYSTLLCDIWGVIHDGAALFDGVEARLLQWSGEGRRIVLITNAPRTAATVQGQLDALGLSRRAYHAITTGGEAGISALLKLGAPVGLIGTREDRDDLERAGLVIAAEGYRDLACTGLDEARATAASMIEQARLAADGVFD